MNRALLPPTAWSCVADRVECEFVGGNDAGAAVALAFDDAARLLASGHERGRLVVWDLELRGVAKAGCRAATECGGRVEAIAWTPRRRRVVSRGARAGGGATLAAWALEGGADGRLVALASVRLGLGAPSPGLTARRAGAADWVLAVDAGRARVLAFPTTPRERAVALATVADLGAATAAVFAGNRGVALVDGAGLRLRASSGAAYAAAGEAALSLGKAATLALAASRDGSRVAAASADGRVRVFAVDASARATPTRVLASPVDRLRWSSVGFGGGGEHVVAGGLSVRAGGAAEIHVWEAASVPARNPNRCEIDPRLERSGTNFF